jgi:hypothetical protein
LPFTSPFSIPAAAALSESARSLQHSREWASLDV